MLAKLSRGEAMGRPERSGMEETTFLPTLEPKRREEKAEERVDWNGEGRGGMGGQEEGKSGVRCARVTALWARPSAMREGRENSSP